MNTLVWWRRASLLLAPVLLSGAFAWADEPYARSREYDLQNTRIHLNIDPEQQRITGEVTHTLAPLRDGLSRLEFDSVNLTIASVTLGGQAAKFETPAGKLVVQLPRPARAGEKLEVTIRYSGAPKRQGMTFILPDQRYPDRAPHLWTQGEAEETRYYIPIYDYPNDLTTSEMIATVPKSWTTVSNGTLLSVKDASGGKKTWHWRQSQPHAVYLISLVAGEFDEAKETWRNIPVTYYVPRGQKERIAPTFGRTKKMLDFFSEKYGVAYPWDKYAQIAVEEHFGGMEHTSASTLTASATFHPQLFFESPAGSDDLLAHELAHQWFGDLITCKDWSNLWINEGFASQAEVLWDEAQYGQDAADYTRWQTRNNWLASQRLFTVPIGTRDFTDATQFGGNTYGKANLVLHMLRHELGDANYFRAIRHFLEKHRHQNVVGADLARAVEEATGRNIEAFLDQWIYHAGAPRLEARYEYDAASHQVKLTLKQTQKVEGAVPLFRVRANVEITTATGKAHHPITLSKAEETFTLPAPSEPLLVLFDPGSHLLRGLVFKKEPKEWIYQLRKAATVPDRADAARALGEVKDNPEVVAALGEAARNDAFWGVRTQALRALGAISGPAAQKEIESALANPQPWVRQVVVDLMGGFKDAPDVAGKLERIYREDSAYRVRAAALGALARQKAENTYSLLAAAVKTESPDHRLRSAGLRGLGALQNDDAVPTLLEWAAPGKPFGVRSAAIAGLGELDKKNKDLTRKLVEYAREPYNSIRFASLAAIGQRNDPEAIGPLEELLKSGELDGFVEQFARGLVTRLKQPPRPQGGQPAGQPAPQGAPPAAQAPAPGAALDAAQQALLQKIEKLEKENAELRERVKKLEEKANAPK